MQVGVLGEGRMMTVGLTKAEWQRMKWVMRKVEWVWDGGQGQGRWFL